MSLLASAQEQNPDDLTDLSLEDLAQVRLATASRHLDDPRKAPSAVTAITADEIRVFGWRTLGELLRTVPGLYTANDRTYEYLGVQGFLQSGDYNARILLLIDGHRINDNVYDAALIGTEFPLDLNRIDRVEIVRGPGSSLYGTNAELAVVNVYTRHPDTQPTAEVSSAYQTHLGRQGELSLSFRHGLLDGFVSGSLYRSNGAERLYFEEYDAAQTNNGIAERADGDRNRRLFGVIRRGQFRLEGLWGSRLKIAPNAPYESNFNDPAARSSDTRGFVEGSYHHFQGATELDFRAYYDAYRFRGGYPYGGMNAPQRQVEVNLAAADWLGAEAVVARKLGKHRMVGGLSGEYNLRIDQKTYFEGLAPFFDDKRKPGLFAAFGELELNPRKWISVNLGGRIDWYSTSGAALSPRFALMLLPNSRTSLKYVRSGAFREPDPFDLYSVDLNFLGSTQLQPENMHAQMLLFEQKLSSWGSLTIDAFENRLDGAIEQVYDAASGEDVMANTPGDKVKGVELELNAKSESGWKARGSYTYTQSREEEVPRVMMNSPRHLVKFNGIAPLRQWATLGVEMLYSNAQISYREERVSPYLLVNTTLASRRFRNGIAASLSCYNVLDRRWATPTGAEVMAPATVQDGRSLRFQLTFRKPWGRR